MYIFSLSEVTYSELTNALLKSICLSLCQFCQSFFFCPLPHPESLQPHNAQALSSQLYRYGVTRPAGAFFNHIGKQQLFPSVAHALVYDQTHDNPSVAEKHCVYDFLPLSALNAIVCCAIGSTRGYDELVPHNIDVVKEVRPYAKWPDKVNPQTGLIGIKSILNEMHTWLSAQGFTETFVEQVSVY